MTKRFYSEFNKLAKMILFMRELPSNFICRFDSIVHSKYWILIYNDVIIKRTIFMKFDIDS